ncbi:MAG: hypothetical protein DDG60_02110 [Anaerolineae bacterium]|nr:MAG: hypothetical protein DDG60_02110 [Anaerolineae bacterium]
MYYSIGLFAEGGNEGGLGWLVWVALVIFFIMVFLGWWVSQKGWLKSAEEPAHEAHGADESGHHPAEPSSEPPLAASSTETTAPAAAEPPAAPAPTGATQPDDLTTLEGIGPKVAKLLAGIGITTFQQLAEADLATLRQALDTAGYKYMEPAGWVEQAALAAKGDMEGLKKLQETLKGGRKPN